jgi:hypothetical protein
MKRTKYIYLFTEQPSYGKFKKDSIIFNSNPIPGGNVGWACISPGTANSLPWKPNTSYTVGTQINANGKVYECILSGTSGTKAPSHSTGSVQEGSLVWKFIDSLAIFKTWGTISS